MAGDFQQGITRLVTGAGDVTDNMKVMGKGILDASVATGVLTSGTDGLNAAMYQIISSGQRGAQALNTLTVAAKGSQIEQANVVDVSKALTTAMTDYGTKQYDATQFMNGYIAAVSRGKITLEELSNTMGPILPLAKNLGISFSDVSAAMATMTNAGIPASRAATSLRFLFQSLEEPTKKASTAMKEWGVDSVALGNELRVSLPGALEMIYNAAKRAGPEGSVPFNRAVADMIGGQRSLQAYLALTGTHFATFSTDAKQIAAAMDGSKSAVNGWALAQGNFNIKMGEAHAALNAMFIILGTQLLPVMTQLAASLVPVIQGFTSWAVSSGGLASIILGIVSFVSLLFAKLQANGALKEFLQILMNIGDIVRNVVNTALLILSGLFGTVSTNAGPAADAATNVAGALKKIADIGVLITGILKAVTGAFADTGAAGTLLRLALDGVAIAFVAIKIGNFINMFVTMLPLMIAGAVDMWAFAAAAWGAVVPLGILSLPLWAIILGIAVLVAAILGIIVAIRNWGNIVSWVGTVFSGLGTVVHNIIVWIQGLNPWIQALILGLASLGTAIGIVVVAQLAWAAATATGGIIELITLLPAAVVLLGYWVAATWSAVASQVALKAVDVASMFVGFIAMLPTVIALGWAWVVELTAQAVAMVAAYWPILLIIAAIAAIIAIIVLVIAHWGQLSGAISAACAAIKNVVGAAFDWIGAHIRDVLTGVKNFVGGVFSGIGTVVHDRLTELKNTVGQQFSNLGTLAHDGVMSVAHGVVDGFHWMYDHNIYVKQMVDANTILFSTMSTRTQQLTAQMVTGVGQQFSNLGTLTRDSMTMMKNSVGDAFNVMGTVARDRSTELKNTVGQQFSNLGTLVHDSMTMMKNFVGDQFSTMGTIASQQSTTLKNNVGQAFSNLGTAVHGAVVSMWNDVTSQFAGAWGRISPVLSGLWNSISGWFTGLANRAFSWGANVLGQFVSGFQSMMGNLGNAIGNAAGAVANFLGFHSPAKEGPGADADKWAPNLMRMLSEGIRLGTPQLQLALNASLKPPGFAASTLLSPTSSAGTPQTIVLQIDGRALGHAIATNMASEIKLKMGVY